MASKRPMSRDAVASLRWADEIARERAKMPRGFGIRDVTTGLWVTAGAMHMRAPGLEHTRAHYQTAGDALKAMRANGMTSERYMVCGILD